MRKASTARRSAALTGPSVQDGDGSERLAAMEAGLADREAYQRLMVEISALPYAISTVSDRLGVAALWRDGVDGAEIRAWARLGPMGQAYRLSGQGLTATEAAVFLPANGPTTWFLTALGRMLHKARASGMAAGDVRWWFQAGVVSLRPPFVDEAAWGRWRRVGLTCVGPRMVAQAAAAGLEPGEVEVLAAQGALTLEAVRLMAAMRSL